MTTDSAIIRDSLAEPARFAALYDRHARRLYRFLAARLGTHAAEDVLSETFLVAFRARSRFDLSFEDSSPWLFGIAIRLAHRHRRIEARHLVGAGAAGSDEAHDPTPATDDALDAVRAVEAMRSRLLRLHQRDRDALLLYAWADLTYEQIAAALGIPVGTVRSRLNRARRLLRTDDTNGTTHA
ncbi:RNA polymerase sigma factor [Amnibacterium sp.]|uniref:RNA polymerase sigma factor n=1 Tax=Amnibacterium sp. TaxID=1872496 RepID=UPI003F7C8C17